MTAPESNPGKENWETFVADKTEVSYLIIINCLYNIIILPHPRPSVEFFA